MARHAKNYCDYFPHDRDMRNHRKVKAIRNKFPLHGYTIWSMLLEYLTGIDGNEFEYNDVEFELMAGDFGVSATEIRSVVDYALQLEMLFNKDGFIHSESLDKNLKPVYDKRQVSKERSEKQRRKNGKFAGDNTDGDGQSVTEKPQIRVDNIKVDNKEKINKKESTRKRRTKAGTVAAAQIKIQGITPTPDDIGDLPEIKIQKCIELLKITSQQDVTKDQIIGMWGVFKIQNLTGKKWYPSVEDVETHFINWVKDKKFKKNEEGKKSIGRTFTKD